MSLRLTNIQRFCTGDGPGIRTTLFTKGCSILCPWCANSENLSGELQYYKSDQCLAWNNSCSLSNTCKGNKCVSSLKQEDYERCPITAIKIYGKDWEIEDIESVCLKDTISKVRPGPPQPPPVPAQTRSGQIWTALSPCPSGAFGTAASLG